MQYAYVRRAYNVAPEIGARVRHTELRAPRDFGIIAPEDPGNGHRVMVRFDGDAEAMPCHPTALDYDASDHERLPMWVVYDRPSDYPDSFVARRFVTPPEPRPTAEFRTAHDIDELREHFVRLGLAKLDRDLTDDPKIVEVWL